MEKQVKMTIEQAKDLFKSNPEFRNTLLSVFTDEELGIDSFPKHWENLGLVDGWYVDTDASILQIPDCYTYNDAKNIFATEKQAKSALAFAQLTQLAAKVNGDWIPDWTNSSRKYIVFCQGNELQVDYNFKYKHKISFKTQELAEKSLKYHEQLWKDYYMID